MKCWEKFVFQCLVRSIQIGDEETFEKIFAVAQENQEVARLLFQAMLLYGFKRMEPMSPIENLTQLQYSEERKGPFMLYIYDNGRPGPGQWFREIPVYPDEEITSVAAKVKSALAVARGAEVRICDGGDMLVFHSKGGKILFGEKFWEEIGL
jgi:hypothetical protein